MGAGLSMTVMDWTEIVHAMDAESPASKRWDASRLAETSGYGN
jgi:hypothetical protein